MTIIKSIVTRNPCYKEGKTIAVRGLMLHSVGVGQPKASVFINTWNSTTYRRSCVHAIIDANTGDVYQLLPWNYRGWHAGGAANDTHIGVEMCEPAGIRYTDDGARFIITNATEAKASAKRAYNAAVELFAHLCTEYSLNPLASGVIIGHAEGYARGVASNHADPEHLWKGLGLPYTMDKFRAAVKEAMRKPRIYYCVQVGAFSAKTRADMMAKSLRAFGFDTYIVEKPNGLYCVQVGAYSKKANANAIAKTLRAAGFDTYITTNEN